MENLRDLTDDLERQRIDRRTFLRRAVALGLSLPAAGAILAACAPAPAPTAAPAPPQAPPAAGGAVDLAAITEAAKKEGVVSIAGNMLQGETSRKAVADGFVKRYGLPSSFQVQWINKTGALSIKQVDEELAAGKLTVDVPYHNTAAWFYAMAKAGKLLAFDSPEYAGYAKLDSRSGFNFRPYYVGDVSILATPVWNTDVIKGEFKSWFDFLKPEYKGKISITSARAAPSMAVTYKGMKESPEIGKKFFEELAKLQPTTFTQTDQMLEKVASGEYPLSLTGAVGRAFNMWKNNGVKHLAQSYPKEGLVPLSVNAAVMAAAPHPNAGKLFLNYLRSQEGQQTIADTEGRVSGRGDIKSQNPMFLPNIDDLKVIWVDQANIPPEEFDKLGKEWEEMFGA